MLLLGLTAPLLVSTGAPTANCSNGTFPIDRPLVQCFGGVHQPSVVRPVNVHTPAAGATPAECQMACCAKDGCIFWGFADATAVAKVKGCWTSTKQDLQHCENNRVGWVGRSVGDLPIPPAKGAVLPIRLDHVAIGPRFDGAGGIVDASSRFMFDYPEPQRSEICDFLFKPHFGASFSILKVEVGGDAQQTDGSTASFRHNRGEAPNFNRSHIWWAIGEAKARRQDMLLYGLAWGFPGYLGDFYDGVSIGNYLTEWITGAKAHHGVDIDVIGLWNERQPCSTNPKTAAWNCSTIFGLRAALDTAGLQSVRIAATDGTVGSMDSVVATNAPFTYAATHGFGALSPSQSAFTQAHNLPRWRSESEDTYKSSATMATNLVQSYLISNVTAVVVWPATQGYYPVLPWAEYDMFFYANSPWSGTYTVSSAVWVLAHLTQFADPGWRYLRQGQGTNYLSGGGSYAALIPEDGAPDELVVLIETAAAGTDQELPFVVPGGLIERWAVGDVSGELEVWQSNLTTNDPDAYFHKLPPINVASNGTFVITIPPHTLTTITSRLGLATKGTYPASPPAAPFPLPYRVNYTALSLDRQGPFHTDQQGAWEVAQVDLPRLECTAEQGGVGRPSVGSARGLLQAVTQVPIQWVYATQRPVTIFGDPTWNNVSVSSTAIILDQSQYTQTVLFDCQDVRRFSVPGESGTKGATPIGGTFVSIGVRAIVGGNICGAGKNDTGGYFLLVHSNGTFTVTRGSQVVLASGNLPTLTKGRRCSEYAEMGTEVDMMLTAKGDTIDAFVGGVHVASVVDGTYSAGFAALASGWHRALFTQAFVTPESGQ